MTTPFSLFPGNAQSVCDFTDNGANKRRTIVIGEIMAYNKKTFLEFNYFHPNAQN